MDKLQGHVLKVVWSKKKKKKKKHKLVPFDTVSKWRTDLI
jgi:hypothetical protein